MNASTVLTSGFVGSRPHSHAERYARKIHVRPCGDFLCGYQLTEPLPGEDHYVCRHAASELARQSFVALFPATHLTRS